MGQSRLDALILMYIHKDIPLDYDNIIERYAVKHPRRMKLINPLISVESITITVLTVTVLTV